MNADVTCLDFHPNCNYIAGGGEDKLTRIWEVSSGMLVRAFGDETNGTVKSVKVRKRERNFNNGVFGT